VPALVRDLVLSVPGFRREAGLGGFTAIGKSGAKGRWRTNQAKVEFTPLDCGYTTLYETGMPKVGHAIENIAPIFASAR
jgi:hypothetical protein